MMMSWLLLFVASVFEVVWAVSMKFSYGFTKVGPSICTLIAMLISFFLLAISMKNLPLGTAYATWTGLGAIGSFIMGIIIFKEPVTVARMVSAGLIFAGIVGMKISTT